MPISAINKMEEYKFVIPDYGRPLTADQLKEQAIRVGGIVAKLIAANYQGNLVFDPNLVEVVNALKVEYVGGVTSGKLRISDDDNTFKIQYWGFNENIGDIRLNPNGKDLPGSIVLFNNWSLTPEIREKIAEQLRKELAGVKVN